LHWINWLVRLDRLWLLNACAAELLTLLGAGEALGFDEQNRHHALDTFAVASESHTVGAHARASIAAYRRFNELLLEHRFCRRFMGLESFLVL
jgi:hypothetical protein